MCIVSSGFNLFSQTTLILILGIIFAALALVINKLPVFKKLFADRKILKIVLTIIFGIISLFLLLLAMTFYGDVANSINGPIRLCG